MPLSDHTTFSQAQVGSELSRPVFIKAIEEKPGKDGKIHLHFTLLDGESECQATLFSTTAAQMEQAGIHTGIVADITLRVSEFNGKSFNVNGITPYQGDELTIDDFIVTAPLNELAMFDEMIETLHSIGDDMGGTSTPVSELAVMILTDHKKEFLRSAAAKNIHHNFKGGLIYHSYRMFKAAEAIMPVYPELDKELLMTSAAIHDIGKLWEYSTDPYGTADVTGSGVLFGHLYMGAKLISNYMEKLTKTSPDAKPFNGEKARMLTHIILSHHGRLEWGAVATPAIPEAFVLHYLDNLDAKVNSCEKEYAKLAPGEASSKKPMGFDGKIYKPDYKV